MNGCACRANHTRFWRKRIEIIFKVQDISKVTRGEHGDHCGEHGDRKGRHYYTRTENAQMRGIVVAPLAVATGFYKPACAASSRSACSANCLVWVSRMRSRRAKPMKLRIPSSETTIRMPPIVTFVTVEAIQCCPDGCVVMAKGEMVNQMPVRKNKIST